MADAPQRIPVTILSGFLGAGKTTLLNKLIQLNPGKKLAIIENEFGQVPIDSELVLKQDDGIFELSNGCVCCSLNGELVEILLKLVNGKRRIDHLVIETTGIADPGPIALNFISDYKVQTMFRLDGVVTLADARFIEQQLENEHEAARQIAMADVVLVNKTDAVEKYQVDVVRNIVTHINPQARVLEASYGNVNGLDLLDLQAFSKENILKATFANDADVKPVRKLSPMKRAAAPTDGTFAAVNKTHFHASQVGSCSFVFADPLDPIKFDTWIKMLLHIGFNQFYRVKGILNAEGIDKKIIFQAVHNQYVTESGGDWENSQRQTKIVFIGKNLDKEMLQLGMESCLAGDETAMDSSFYETMLKIQDDMYQRVQPKA